MVSKPSEVSASSTGFNALLDNQGVTIKATRVEIITAMGTLKAMGAI